MEGCLYETGGVWRGRCAGSFLASERWREGRMDVLLHSQDKDINQWIRVSYYKRNVSDGR